ncbi:MAG TPA: HigA family addiction module antitoxin [Rhizobiaceae bacterium]|nr:HigA family addiction module antitoxin [Rhizobiaceae bacterium]
MAHKSKVLMHPGEFLREEFMTPLGLSARKVAEMIDVPANRISELAAERRAMSADTAFRLERLFGMPAYMWMGFQQEYDAARTLAENDYSSIKPYETRLAS